GACTAAAYRAVGEPPGSRDTVTDFSASTSSGESISGQARTTTGDGSLGSIAEGMQKAERQQQYRAALNSVYSGCMAQHGWYLQRPDAVSKQEQEDAQNGHELFMACLRRAPHATTQEEAAAI